MLTWSERRKELADTHCMHSVTRASERQDGEFHRRREENSDYKELGLYDGRGEGTNIGWAVIAKPTGGIRLSAEVLLTSFCFEITRGVQRLLTPRWDKHFREREN